MLSALLLAFQLYISADMAYRESDQCLADAKALHESADIRCEVWWEPFPVEALESGNEPDVCEQF